MKIIKNLKRYQLTFRMKQFPWALQKMLRLRRRKWARIKFSRRYLIKSNKSNKAMKYKLFKTYKEKTKKIFKRFFAPQLNDRQFKKLFRSNPRYKSTLKRVLNVEYRLDTLIYRLFMFSDINIARALIKNKFFLVNKKLHSSPHIILSVGDLIEPSNSLAWKFVYDNMLQVTAGIQKYLNRLFFKFSFPFVIKKKNFRLKEFGKFKDKKLKSFTFGRHRRVKIRVFFNRFLGLKTKTTSKKHPRKIYTFFPKKSPRNFRQFTYGIVLQAHKNNVFITRAMPTSSFPKTFFESKKRLKFKKVKLILHRVSVLNSILKYILKKKNKFKPTKKYIFNSRFKFLNPRSNFIKIYKNIKIKQKKKHVKLNIKIKKMILKSKIKVRLNIKNKIFKFNRLKSKYKHKKKLKIKYKLKFFSFKKKFKIKRKFKLKSKFKLKPKLKLKSKFKLKPKFNNTKSFWYKKNGKLFKNYGKFLKRNNKKTPRQSKRKLWYKINRLIPHKLFINLKKVVFNKKLKNKIKKRLKKLTKKIKLIPYKKKKT